MALVVEDGTGVAGANSYLSVAELRAFAEARGISLPADEVVEQLLVRSADYLEVKKYIGTRSFDSQGLSWPRTSTSTLYPKDYGVPPEIKRAQYLLAIEAQNGPLMAVARPNEFVRTKIDVVYVEFAKTADLALGMRYYAVDALLQKYMSNGDRAFSTVRA